MVKRSGNSPVTSNGNGRKGTNYRDRSGHRGNGAPRNGRANGGRNYSNGYGGGSANPSISDSQEMNTHISERFGKGGNRRKFANNETAALDDSQIIVRPRHRLLEEFESFDPKCLEDPWRHLPEIPTADEVMSSEVLVAPNIIDGPHESLNSYLQAHYELLREDAVAHLRDGVIQLRLNPGLDDQPTFCIYDNVRIIGFTWAKMGVCAKVNFSLARAGKRILWANSKRLLPGSVVALSSDDFQTVRIATVAARPLAGLKMSIPEVDLLFDENDFELDVNKVYVMVETRSAYFEAYKHTLRGLQRIQEDGFPLAKYLVDLRTDIGTPEYVQKNPIYDISHIFPDEPNKERLRSVNIMTDFPKESEVNTSLDATQLDALHRILTKEISIVQGPPGTGKTHTSVKALEVMIANMAEGDPPILIACQTNHALDQILRYVLNFEENIIRLGGRTKDREKIKERTLYEVRNKVRINVQNQSVGRASKKIANLERAMKEILEEINTDIIAPSAFKRHGLLREEHCKSFSKGAEDWITSEDNKDDPANYMRMWLGKENIRSIEYSPDDFLEYEEEDLEMEQLQELEAEFLGGGTEDDFDDSLRGSFLPFTRKHETVEPYDVTEGEIEAALRKNDVWSYPQHIRLAVYLRLRKQLYKKVEDEFKSLYREYMSAQRDLRTALLEKDAYILETAKVVGMTTTGLGKYRSLIGSLKPRILLIEEAAESLEGPLIVGCLPTIQHLILVGDHKQLHGSCAVKELEGQPYYLKVSMFERLVYNGIGYTMLKHQRRMRPEFRELLRPIYDDELMDHALVFGREPVKGMGGINLWFYTHEVYENIQDGTSRSNSHEADMVAGLANHLVLNGLDPEKLTVLTFYSGQRDQIRRKLRNHPHLRQYPNIRVATVDSFQGEENEVILLSLVRSNLDGKIGFLDISNRVCVALSRARTGFYMFGNAGMMTRASLLWWEIAQIMLTGENRIGATVPITCEKHQEIKHIAQEAEWLESSGGCGKKCTETLPCGHACPLNCHPWDHTLVSCKEECSNFLECGHRCEKACTERCSCKHCDTEEEVQVFLRASDNFQNGEAPGDVAPVKPTKYSKDPINSVDKDSEYHNSLANGRERGYFDQEFANKKNRKTRNTGRPVAAPKQAAQATVEGSLIDLGEDGWQSSSSSATTNGPPPIPLHSRPKEFMKPVPEILVEENTSASLDTEEPLPPSKAVNSEQLPFTIKEAKPKFASKRNSSAEWPALGSSSTKIVEEVSRKQSWASKAKR